MSWNAALQELNISVPQTELEARPQGEISPLVYDDGINAGFVNYAFSGSHSRFSSGSSKQDSDYYFLTLNNGLNVGAWRFSQQLFPCQNRPGKRAVEPDFHRAETDIASPAQPYSDWPEQHQ